jgi:phosphoenolpyruvate---glycerone phosphotransferase subunit DhaL
MAQDEHQQGLSMATLSDWLRRFSDAVLSSEAALNELDAATGDGEHGSNLAQGARAVGTLLDHDEPFTDVREQFAAVGMAIVNSVGGASGALYGTFFLRLSDVGAGRTDLDVDALTTGLVSALSGMRELGGAAPGDKTLIDALHPAVAALRDHRRERADLLETLALAASAAEQGRDATAGMRARIGRGSYLGERSLGHVDAGATSMAMLLRCLHAAGTSQGTQSPAVPRADR